MGGLWVQIMKLHMLNSGFVSKQKQHGSRIIMYVQMYVSMTEMKLYLVSIPRSWLQHHSAESFTRYYSIYVCADAVMMAKLPHTNLVWWRRSPGSAGVCPLAHETRQQRVLRLVTALSSYALARVPHAPHKCNARDQLEDG